MKNILLFLVLVLLGSCQKEDDTLVSGQIVVKETNEPIPRMVMIFDVASGSGFLGSSVERQKYKAVTDQDGKFSFIVDEADKDNFLWVNSASDGTFCWDEIDTTSTQNKFKLQESLRYIQRDVKTTLHYVPRGRISFQVTKKTFAELNVDTVIIQAPFASDTLINDDPYNSASGSFRQIVSQDYEFTFSAIKNNKVKKSFTKNIFVRHECLVKKAIEISF